MGLGKWYRCALEFGRVTGGLNGDQSWEACVAMSLRARQTFEHGIALISPQPRPIGEWVEQRFRDDAPKTFLELGSHVGTDTEWMAPLPNVTIHAFEPDPRNHQPPRDNVIQRRMAIAQNDGRAQFILSHAGWGQEWTHSSSIKRPKNHLHRYPVTFGDTISVDAITLDTYCRKEGLAKIDTIWADIQGARAKWFVAARKRWRAHVTSLRRIRR